MSAAAPVGMTIVVADDDDAVRAFVAESLRSVGYTVLEARDGDQALACVGAAPDLLLTDLVMPPRGGLELAEAMRAHIPDLAVLYMSGYGSRTDFNDDASASLINKPFTVSELRDHVDWLLLTRPSR